MNCTSSFLPYLHTGYFSRIVLDYISEESSLKPFYNHPVSVQGIKAAIQERSQFKTNRPLLVTALKKQYGSLESTEKVNNNIESLLSDNTFTICTAHQPNIFTGHLYFIYKILHTVKIAHLLNDQIPSAHFVPVYYMGSEDADLEELGHFFIHGGKHEWTTTQTGAVGRMKVDTALIKLLDKVAGQLSVYPYGKEILGLMKQYYTEGQTIEQATFQLVNMLFAKYGLVIVLPDNPDLKHAFIPVIQRELVEAFSHTAVDDTVSKLPAEYKVQASGRDINMFYLNDDKRERIERIGDEWRILNSTIKFSQQELLTELNDHPERFSPNVILRPVFQEWILPNIAFIGGGGEIAYWLQLKKVFEAVNVPYPLLVVRNSFLLIDQANAQLINNLKLNTTAIFRSEIELINELVKRDTRIQINLENEQIELSRLYDLIKSIAGNVDHTLLTHTQALQTQALKRIGLLEKKMLRAEKKKFEAALRQLQKMKSHLFPNNSLQERVENIMPLYAKWGNSFINAIYENSLTFEQQFTILVERE